MFHILLLHFYADISPMTFSVPRSTQFCELRGRLYILFIILQMLIFLQHTRF